MKQPFEGLFGDTCETRILQFLLPLYGIEFSMQELADEVKLTRQSVSRVMKKFSAWGITKARKEGRNLLFSINEDSPIVQRIEDLDNELIAAMTGSGEPGEISAGTAIPARDSSSENHPPGNENALGRHSRTKRMIRV